MLERLTRYAEIELAGNSEEFLRIGELDRNDYRLRNERVLGHTLEHSIF